VETDPSSATTCLALRLTGGLQGIIGGDNGGEAGLARDVRGVQHPTSREKSTSTDAEVSRSDEDTISTTGVTMEDETAGGECGEAGPPPVSDAAGEETRVGCCSLIRLKHIYNF
jgi:hypothetical protein